MEIMLMESTRIRSRLVPRRGTEAGQAMLVAVLFFMVVSFVLVIGVASPIFNELRSAATRGIAQQSFLLGEAAAEDLTYRYKHGMHTPDASTINLAGASGTATTTTTSDGVIIQGRGNAVRSQRAAEVELKEGEGIAFNYGVQVGGGGVVLDNSSYVSGNVYANGKIEGIHDNEIKGTAVSAGDNGLITGVHATGSAYAYRIEDSEIDEDAYYQEISNTVVWGTEYPGSEPEPTTTFPISNELLDSWEEEAENGQVINCTGTYTINSATTTGPVKFTCDLEISGNDTITIEGPVWVEGSITSKNNPIIDLDESLGRTSVAIIADNPSDRTTDSQIFVNNNVTFEGTDDDAYILFVSRNTSARKGGSNVAMEWSEGGQGDVLVYAPDGSIELKQSISMKEVTAYKILLRNKAEVVYESGLANLLFSSGPGGGFAIERWEEVK